MASASLALAAAGGTVGQSRGRAVQRSRRMVAQGRIMKRRAASCVVPERFVLL